MNWKGAGKLDPPLANQNPFFETYWHTANYINQGNKADWYRDKTVREGGTMTTP